MLKKNDNNFPVYFGCKNPGTPEEMAATHKGTHKDSVLTLLFFETMYCLYIQTYSNKSNKDYCFTFMRHIHNKQKKLG